MGPRRPPDILRKSHAHSDGKPRARDKRELSEALEASMSASFEHHALLIGLDGVVFRDDGLIPGAAQVIHWLAEQKIPHFFIADTESLPPEGTVAKLASNGIHVEVDMILDAASGGLTPAFFEAALEGLGVEAADTWMIGDDIHTEIAAAQAAGIKGILVRTGRYRTGDTQLGIDPALVIDSIADLPGALAHDASS